MVVEHGENADASQASAPDGTQGENADVNVSEAKAAENKRIEEIMSFVTGIYQPDASKMIMRDNRQFVLPPWGYGPELCKMYILWEDVSSGSAQDQ